MILQEFVHMKKKEEEMAKALEGLNKKREKIKGKEDYCDDGIKPECKCEWQEDENCCEYVCRPRCR